MPIQGKQVFGDDIQKIINDLNEGLIKVNSQLKEMSSYGQKISGAKNIKELKTETDGLNKVNTQLKNSQDDVVKAQLRYQTASSEQKKILKDQIILESKESGELEKLAAKNRLLEIEKRKLKKTDENYNNKLKEINVNQDKNNKLMKEAGNSAQKQSKGIGSYFSSIVKGGLALAGVSIGLQTLKKGFTTMVNSIQGLGDRWAIFTGGLKEGMNSVFQTMASGDFSFKNLIQNFKDARKAGEEYAGMLDSLGDRQRAQSIIEAEAKHTLVELEKIYRDATKTNEERIKAINNLISKENELNKGRVENAKLAFDAELTIAKERSGLSEDQILDYLRNYTIYEESETKLKELEEERSNLTGMKANAQMKLQFGLAKQYQSFIDILDQDIEKEKELNKTYEGQNKLVDEGIGSRKSLTDAYINLLTTEEQVFEQNKRLFTARGTLQEELNVKELKMLSDRQKAEKDYLEIKGKDDEDFLNAELLNIDKQIEADNKKTESKIANAQKEHEDYLLKLEEKIAAEKQFGEIKKETIFSTFDFAQSLVSREIEMTSRKYDNEIKNAGDNKKLIEEIEKKKAVEIAKIQRKQAILDKAAALIDIAINTAIGVTKVTAQTGIGALLAVPLVIASGALQAGIVLAKPLPEIPSFYTGVKDFKGGAAIVGDAPSGKSTELVKLPDHRNFIVSEPTMIKLPAGADVVPEKHIQQELAKLAMRGENVIMMNGGINKNDLEKLGNNIIKGINSKPETINYFKGATLYSIRRGKSWTFYKDKTY